jgi:lysophospholipid hydrolase
MSETISAAMQEGTAQLSSIAANASQLADDSSAGSWITLTGRLVLGILHLVSTILYYVVKLTTISIPTLLFSMFSASLTVTMNATTLMLILATIISAVSWVVRYRYLNMYSRLPPEPQRKEPEIDLFPDTHEEGVKSGLSSYLDEFLSAIKIFGYLERPVFHELTRSMQTRKLIAGETLNLEEEKGFCLVVDGLVEIFVKSSQSPSRRQTQPMADGRDIAVNSSSEEEEIELPGQQRYQLLTEVRNGAPMSSLFTIMSLFTEEVKLRTSDDDTPDPSPGVGRSGYSRNSMSADLSRSQGLAISVPSTPFRSSMNGKVDGGSDLPDRRAGGSSALPSIPPISLDGSSPATNRAPSRPTPLTRRETKSVHPDIIARATVDTTIAIIPASAFRRLIRIYPKATSHIVHVILSRFQRVTLATAYSYLGLTGEVMQTEKSMVKYTTNQLPNFLRGDALQRLKEKFGRERDRIGEAEVGKGIALHNAQVGRPRRSTMTLRKGAALQALSRQQSATMADRPTWSSRDRESRDSPSPGDLLANVQMQTRTATSRPMSMGELAQIQVPPGFDAFRAEGVSPLAQRAFNPFATQKHARMSLDTRETVGEDSLFRQSILECMFESIGLNGSGTTSREPESMEGSPRLVSFDQGRQKAVFSNNAFGFMESLDSSLGDGESESIASSSLPTSWLQSPQALAHDMKDEVDIVFFPKGSILVEQGERSPGLYYVIDGFLDIGMTKGERSADLIQSSSRSTTVPPHGLNLGGGSRERLFPDASVQQDAPQPSPSSNRQSIALIKPGGLAGYIGTVSSYRSFIDVVAKTDVYVGFLPRASLERIVDRYPIVLLTMAKRLTNLLPRLILHIDFALEWLQVNAGQVIFHEGDESEAIYLVLNGRLRLVNDRKDGGMHALAEFGQGESVGELEVLTESVRPGTLHAIRATELVKFPRTLFNSLAQEHPNITIKISKIIASRMRAVIETPTSLAKDGVSRSAMSKISPTLNLRTVAVLPVTAGVPVVEFGAKLMAALSQVGPPNGATSLSQSAILNHLGRHAFNKMGKLKLSQYLADLEEKYGLVIYLADTNVNSPWTQTCITQADCILMVGPGDGSPEIGEYERFMLGMKSTARKILVLLHAERYSKAGITRAWLKNRPWINGGHFHVQMAYGTSMPLHPQLGKRMGTILKQRVQILQAEIQKYTSRKARTGPFYSPNAPTKGDFQRLARRLCGKSVGLVLGGGGARGIAQIGIIRALEEAGIPIDVVGGTSIGAFIGALYARHADVVPIFGLAKKFAGRMASMWRFALDLTYPSTSYTTGHEFNRGIFKTFGKTQIEDFWLEYYCNTTNISKSRAEFHTSGYAWRYVRASMSLTGLLPPLCDEGSLLVDGGFIDNLTVSRMKSLGVENMFAVDVGALDDDTPQAYGDTLSGLWAFFNRWNPFSAVPNPPTLAEIQARLAYVSSVDALEHAKTMPGCIYLRPPIDAYGTLDFAKFDEICRVGYEYGQEVLAKLRDEGRLPFVEETEAKKALRRTMAPRRASI